METMKFGEPEASPPPGGAGQGGEKTAAPPGGGGGGELRQEASEEIDLGRHYIGGFDFSRYRLAILAIYAKPVLSADEGGEDD